MENRLVKNNVCPACAHPPFGTDKELHEWDECTWCGSTVVTEELYNLADALDELGYNHQRCGVCSRPMYLCGYKSPCLR